MSAALHARLQLARHLRHPALLWLAVATPALAPFMVPREDADYALIGVNDSTITLDAGSLGLQLGVLVAVLAAPLAYMYLRAGPTRRDADALFATLPGGRVAWRVGAWLGDAAALTLWVAALGLAGLVLGLFRLGSVGPVQTLLPLLLLGVPALALVAALRTLFASRPWLRGWGGDVMFFIAWIALIATASATAQGGSAMNDAFGFVASVRGSIDVPMDTFYIGGAPKGEGRIPVDAMRGVLDPDFLASRAAWLGITAAIAAFAGLVWRPSARQARRETAVRESDGFATDAVAPVWPGSGFGGIVAAGVREILNTRLRKVVFAAAIVAAVALPFRGAGGAVVLLALVFLLADAPSLWARSAIMACAPVGAAEQAVLRLGGMLGVAALPLGLAALRSASLEPVIALLAGVPALWLAGTLTRSPVPGRLIGIAGWYIYLNMALQG